MQVKERERMMQSVQKHFFFHCEIFKFVNVVVAGRRRRGCFCSPSFLFQLKITQLKLLQPSDWARSCLQVLFSLDELESKKKKHTIIRKLFA